LNINDAFIYLIYKGSTKIMANIKMLALVVIVALIGLGAATLTTPATLEVSAQGNMTGNQTGNYTETGSGNISGVFQLP
jgi:hypothetical protein